MESYDAPVIGMELQDQIEELLQRATKDSLSGLLNRATMETYIENRLSEMKENEACAFFIIDLDWFKHVNDTFGHQAGDSAIKESARLLSQIFRASDIVGRLGGDEFAVFMSGSGVTEELVRKKAREICDNIQLTIGDKGDITLTASVGICMYKGPEDFNKIYQDADLALYKAKKSGKNTYCFKSWDFFQDAEDNDDFRLVNTIPVNSLLESLDSGIALLEISSDIEAIYISPSLARMLGVSKDLKLPIPISRWVHPSDMPPFKAALEKALISGEAIEQTQRVMTENESTWLWWHIKATRIKIGMTKPVILVTTNDVTAYKERELQLEDSNEILKTAFDQTSQHLWEVDLRKRLYISYEKALGNKREDMTLPFPDGLIEKGIIHSDSIERFRKFSETMLRGQAEDSGNFIMRGQDTGCYGWVSMSYKMMYDDTGIAVRAIGIIDNLSNSFFSDSPETIPQRLMPEALLSDLILRMRLDITNNKIEEVWQEGKDVSTQAQSYSASEILEKTKQRLTNKGGEKEIRDLYDISYIKENFKSDEQWMLCEGHSTDRGGNIRRVRHIWHMTTSPFSGHQMLNAYLINVGIPQYWEEVLRKAAVNDFFFQIFEKSAFEDIASKIFQTASNSMRAAMIFQINGLSGHKAEEQNLILKTVISLLSIGFGGSCILGKYTPERIALIFPDIRNEETLRRRIEEAVTFIRRVMKKNSISESIRFIIGVSTQEQGMTGYAQLITNASYSCTRKWNSPVDTIVFANEGDELGLKLMEVRDKDESISTFSADYSIPMNESEKDVAFNCMSLMLNADSLESSVLGVLRNIGMYYQADRVYILSIAKEKRVVTMPFEWDEPCKRPIQNVVSGMLLENFSMLKRCLEKKAPMFLTRKENGEEKSWHFTTFPLEDKGVVEGFLCIENSRRHPTSAALFSTLIPYMLHERSRFAQEDKGVKTVEQLMGLPDLRSYMNTIYSLNSDKYSTLGAICIDIPSMPAINNSQGFEYGSKLLWYVSKTLTDIFGPALLFRTWEAEFIAFCPNTTKDVFSGKCMRAVSNLQRRYPQDVRIGSSWADGTFSGRKLVDEARENMHMEKVGPYPTTAGIKAMEGLFTDVEKLNFPQPVVYYQPQIDMNTGSLIGAEALVRGINDQGDIIPPSRFISILEEKGSIRELDLYVLDKALNQVSTWLEMGYKQVPVSVNFSRITLLYPSTLASALAIQSRFPNVSQSALEIEITESSDVIENREFRDIVDRFRNYGLRIGLDDFGSRYANLSLFTNVTFDTVKLDRSLISEIAENPINRMLVHDLIHICGTRGMRCVAEGVETEEQKAALLEMGCHEAQGFYFDKPLPADEFAVKYLGKNL